MQIVVYLLLHHLLVMMPKNINSNIILVDDSQLAKLMIEYNVGVQIKDTFQIKKIDEDFFIEE